MIEQVYDARIVIVKEDDIAWLDQCREPGGSSASLIGASKPPVGHFSRPVDALKAEQLCSQHRYRCQSSSRSAEETGLLPQELRHDLLTSTHISVVLAQAQRTFRSQHVMGPVEVRMVSHQMTPRMNLRQHVRGSPDTSANHEEDGFDTETVEPIEYGRCHVGMGAIVKRQ